MKQAKQKNKWITKDRWDQNPTRAESTPLIFEFLRYSLSTNISKTMLIGQKRILGEKNTSRTNRLCGS